MESFKVLAFFAFLAVCSVAAEIPNEQAPIAPSNADPASSAVDPKVQGVADPAREKRQGLYPLAYSGLPYYSSYAYPYAYSSYAYGAYDDGKYYPGKYEKPYLYRSYPGYYNAAPYYYYY